LRLLQFGLFLTLLLDRRLIEAQGPLCCKAPCQTPQIGTKQLTVNSQIETNGAGTIPRHPWDGNVGLATNTSGHTAVLELN
jgi:hypothetical protein